MFIFQWHLLELWEVECKNDSTSAIFCCVILDQLIISYSAHILYVGQWIYNTRMLILPNIEWQKAKPCMLSVLYITSTNNRFTSVRKWVGFNLPWSVKRLYWLKWSSFSRFLPETVGFSVIRVRSLPGRAPASSLLTCPQPSSAAKPSTPGKRVVPVIEVRYSPGNASF